MRAHTADGGSRGFPMWVNEVDGITAATAPSSPARRAATPLLELRDLFRCNVADPAERWQAVLLSSFVTDLAWVLAAAPELSAVTGAVVLLSGQKGTATHQRRTAAGGRTTYVRTPPQLDRVNPILHAVHAHAQRLAAVVPSSGPVSVLSPDRLVVLEPPLPFPYGTHHTKMALCVNRRGLRVCIFTANLVEDDWRRKAQGIYVQDFPWSATPTAIEGSDPSVRSKGADFAFQLHRYLRCCDLGMRELFDLGSASPGAAPLGVFDADFLAHVNFAKAAVWLVSSVPGRFVGGVAEVGYRVGMCRLAEALQQAALAGSYPVLLSWQYSSQGSLPLAFLHALQAAMCGEAVADAAKPPTRAPDAVAEVQVVYPTEEEVRQSWEGWRAGTALPLRVQSCAEWINARLHRWGSASDHEPGTATPPAALQQQSRHARRENAVDVDGEGGCTTAAVAESATSTPLRRAAAAAYWQFAMPHIKSYAALSADRTHAHWLLLTSANLSQAAWGSLNGGRNTGTPMSCVQFGRSYELGVLYDGSSTVACAGGEGFFSVTAQCQLSPPTAADAQSLLYEVPLGAPLPPSGAASMYLPYSLLRPTPYASTAALRAQASALSGAPAALDYRDVPWVVDVPHRGCDAYGLDVQAAFQNDAPLPLDSWQPLRCVASRPASAQRKRARVE